jgi:glycine/D-amino acid oxidase-like deaminating enzyme
MNHSVEKVLIAGGGSTACLTALFLKTFLGKLDITVVAPSGIPPMTVGESTNGPFTGFLESLGLDRNSVIRECDATLKIASEFDQWTESQQGYRWVHEFQPTARHLGLPLFHYWLKHHRNGTIQHRYQDACFINSALVAAGFAPFKKGSEVPVLPHGYHLDGHKLGNAVRRRAIALGVKFVDGKIASVEKQDNELIAAVTLTSGETLPADFFIDATGFHRTLPNLAYPGEASCSFEPISDYHFCDRSVFVTLPATSDAIRPSTLSTAISSGWVWDIPLRDRVSYGYVYSSRHLDRARAEEEFRSFLHLGDDAKLGYLAWVPGCIKDAWHKNCLSIGVSNAFIEPIESLTSATLVHELNTLLRHFPDKQFHENAIESYCTIVRRQFVDNRDFVSLHYQTAQREDTPFWRDVKTTSQVAPRVDDLILGFDQQAPYAVEGIYDIKGILGMFAARGVLPDRDLPLVDFIDSAKALEIMQDIAIEREQIPSVYQGHAQYLAKIWEG